MVLTLFILFLLHTPVVDEPAIGLANSNVDTFVFGRDESADYSCSVSDGNPLPLLHWTVNGIPADGVQAATGSREVATSTLNVNITELGVGTHTIQCNASVGDLPDASTTVTLTVQAILQNINVLPEMQSLTLDSSMNNTVTLNCSVEANPGPPRIEWLSNGENVTSQAEPVTQIGGILYSSELTLSVGDLEVEKNNITCLAFQDAETPPTMINDTAIINVFGKIINHD